MGRGLVTGHIGLGPAAEPFRGSPYRGWRGNGAPPDPVSGRARIVFPLGKLAVFRRNLDKHIPRDKLS